jgi:hypothetical protein
MNPMRTSIQDAGWRVLLWLLAIQAVVSAVTQPRLFSSDLQAARAAGAGGDAAQVLTVLMVLIALALIFAGLSRRQDRRGTWYVVAPLLTYCLIYNLVAWSSQGKLRLQYLTVSLLLLAVWALGPPDRDRLVNQARRVLIFILTASLIVAVVVPSWAIDQTYENPILPSIHFRLYGILYHPNALGGAASALIGLLLVSQSNLRFRYLQWTLAFSVLFLTFSKTAWIASVVLLVLVVHLRRPLRRRGSHSCGGADRHP